MKRIKLRRRETKPNVRKVFNVRLDFEDFQERTPAQPTNDRSLLDTLTIFTQRKRLLGRSHIGGLCHLSFYIE